MSSEPSTPTGKDLPEFLEAFDEAVVSGRDTQVFFGTAAEKFGTGAPELLQTIKILRAAAPRGVVAGESEFQDADDDTGGALPEQQGRFGRFRVMQQLGVGGNGVVFLAYDPTLRRNIALKLPRLDAVFNPAVEQRFVKEAYAAAALHHPHIVPVFEVGHVGAVRYIVSAYCAGPNLAAWLDERKEDSRRIDPHTAAEWVAGLARAAHYAHGRGIIHRDIKPGNILLDPLPTPDGKPLPTDAEQVFIPQLTDFGIAKWLDEDSQATKTGNILGTLAYMSPEQSQGIRNLIGSATDVYALGAVLYELLTGGPPFVCGSNAQMLEKIGTEEPVPPSRLVSGLSRDLNAICLRCLEKRPDDRYDTALQLAEDLERYLEDRPTVARPAGHLGRAAKWVRRHPARATILFTAMVALFINAGAGWWYSRTLQTALSDTHEAHEEAELLNRNLSRRVYPAEIRRAQQALELGNREQAVNLLDAYRLVSPEEDPRDFAWYHLWAQCNADASTIETGHGEAYYVGFTPDGGRLITAGKDGTIRLWDTQTRALEKTLHGHQSCVNSLHVSSDGTRMVTGSCDRSIGLWDLATESLITQWDTGGFKIGSVMFTPDGGQVLSGDFEGSSLRLWDVSSGKSMGHLDVTHEGNCGWVGFLEKDEGYLPLSSAPRGLGVHRLEDNLHQLRRLADQNTNVASIKAAALSPDRQLLAFASSPLNPRLGVGLDVQLLRVDGDHDFDVAGRLTSHRTSVFALKFSDDGKLLATGTDGGAVCLWDIASQDMVARFVGHTARVTSLEFSRNSRQLLSASADGTVRSWPVTARRPRVCLPVSVAVTETTPRLAFTANNSRLVLAGRDRAQVWSTADWSVSSLPESPVWSYPNAVDCNPDPLRRDACTVAVIKGSELSVWDAETSELRQVCEVGIGGHVALSQDGRWLALSQHDTVTLRDSRDLEPPRARANIAPFMPPPPVALSRDGRRLAATDGEHTYVLVWDFTEEHAAGPRDVPTMLTGHILAVDQLAISPDGDFVGSASRDGTARIWNVESAAEEAIFFNHRGPVTTIAFAPQGSLVASGGQDGAVRVWDSKTGIELLELSEAGFHAADLAFSPDGERLACLYQGADGDAKVVVWSAPR